MNDQLVRGLTGSGCAALTTTSFHVGFPLSWTLARRGADARRCAGSDVRIAPAAYLRSGLWPQRRPGQLRSGADPKSTVGVAP